MTLTLLRGRKERKQIQFQMVLKAYAGKSPAAESKEREAVLDGLGKVSLQRVIWAETCSDEE